MLEALKPRSKPRIIDLVAAAGFDISDWSNNKNGDAGASSNPKYCYNWHFEQEGMFLFNLWLHELAVTNKDVSFKANQKELATRLKGPQRARALSYDEAIKKAFQTGSNPRIIIQDRGSRDDGPAKFRRLDRMPWTVVSYELSTGNFVLQRGIHTVLHRESFDVELNGYSEGESRMIFVKHRKREAKLRKEKIQDHMQKNGGKLICEVPCCNFDFNAVYGELGKGYAHVHHLLPLSKAGDDGISTTLDDLAVVCANCHAMIHRGGECREMSDLIKGQD